MSKIALSPNASGTGVFTIASPSGNTDRTLTLPDEAGTVLTSGTPVLAQKGTPAFSAYPNTAQTVNAATSTKILFQAEQFDATNCYDTSNSRFTPLVAGYYQVTAAIRFSGGMTRVILSLYKNSSQLKALQDIGGGLYSLSGSALVYLNGSSDYVETYIDYCNATSVLNASSADTYFQAVLVSAT